MIATSSFAGYEASTRDFRFIHAVISVPDQPQDSQYPQAYIQLSNGSLGSGDTYARTGVETCLVAENLDPTFSCPGNVQWVAFAETFINSSSPVLSHFVPLDANQSDGNAITITPVTDKTNNSGTPISTLQIFASGSDSSQTLTYTASGLPAGLNINTATGGITGTPTTGSATPSLVTVTVTDTTGASSSITFHTPGITTFTWSATGLAAGITIDPSTGAITFGCFSSSARRARRWSARPGTAAAVRAGGRGRSAPGSR